MSDKRNAEVSNLPITLLPAQYFVEHEYWNGGGRIAERAYAKFSARGGAHGFDVEDWMSAERELKREDRGYVASTSLHADHNHHLDGTRGP